MKTPMRRQVVPLSNATIVPFIDIYDDDRAAGKVIGTSTCCGVVRQGVDAEGIIAIDHGALRFQPLITAGWGRQGVVYGPYSRMNGLAMAVLLSNGHNTSQGEHIGQRFLGRLWRWLRGSETVPPWMRLWQLAFSPQKKGLLRRFRWWFHSSPRRWKLPNLDENLAVGWFPREVPQNPIAEGNAFILHAARGDNGELWARVGNQMLTAFKGLQNIQIYYIVVLRETGAAYYAAAMPNAHGLVAYPDMRPIAIDPFNRDTELYAGMYQSVLGQIGFRVDTRVYGFRVEQVASLKSWYGTAHVADTLVNGGLLHNRSAEVGPTWIPIAGNYLLTDRGASPLTHQALAVVQPANPTGLLHTLVETTTAGTAGLVWRFQDADNCWIFHCTQSGCRLQIRQNGTEVTIAHDTRLQLFPQTLHSVQVLDDGSTFSCYLDGNLVFDQWFVDHRLGTACGVGIATSNSVDSVYFRNFEAHARRIPIPNTLDLGSPWAATGSETSLTDLFDGDSRDLQGKRTTTGGQVWRKEIGKGTIILTGKRSAKVQASVQTPNPGRTAYTVAWGNPTFVDLEVTITPPGTAKTQKERGRGGLIVWQDKDNYLTFSLYLDDDYNGGSIAIFSHLNGYEELYDAVWTMIGCRVSWGVPFRLRLVFDGNHSVLYLNDEPVLYRALTDIYPNIARFHINRIGIVANWEWGDDTGTQFSNFIAKR